MPENVSNEDLANYNNLLNEISLKKRKSKQVKKNKLKFSNKFFSFRYEQFFLSQTIDDILCWPIHANINKPMNDRQKEMLQH